MVGYQLTFFTQQDRMHQGKTLAKWLLEETRAMGIGGATLIAGAEGFGRDGKLRSVHFFELADQPLEVTMAVNETDAERLLTRLKDEGINIFYVKTPIEYGMTGDC